MLHPQPGAHRKCKAQRGFLTKPPTKEQLPTLPNIVKSGGGGATTTRAEAGAEHSTKLQGEVKQTARAEGETTSTAETEG